MPARALPPWSIDLVLAAALAVAGVLGLSVFHLHQVPADGADGLAYLLVLLGASVFTALHRAPLTVLVAASAILLTELARGYSTGLAGLGLFVAAFGVAAWRGRREVAAAVVVAVVVLTGVWRISDGSYPAEELLINVGLFGMALAGGAWAQAHRLHSESLAEQAALAVRERDQAARRAVAEERVRIAEELHDIVAHSMGVIALQAGVGAHVIDRQPAEAKQALLEISRASRETLGEIRRVLGVLRGPDGDGSYEPAPGLADLDDLVEQIRVGGLAVSLDRQAPTDPLPAGLELTAYRIVQEALTNVLKHAHASRADVRLRRRGDQLEIEIVDDGRTAPDAAAAAGPPASPGTPGAPGTPGGHGLLGMRERVALWGGTLDTGPRPEGGFAVRARLPLPAGPAGAEVTR